MRFLFPRSSNRNDRHWQESGMGNKGGCAALVPHPCLLRPPVILNEVSLSRQRQGNLQENSYFGTMCDFILIQEHNWNQTSYGAKQKRFE